MESRPGLGSDEVLSSFLQTKSFGSLDGLRAFAILAVVWHHTGEPDPDWVISGRGFLGVDLFFVISGFLIVTLLLRERSRTGVISLRAFYARRALRIFPAYYFMLLIVGLIAIVKRGNSSDAVIHDLPYAAFYLSNFVSLGSGLAITWSLAAEEQFYLVVPTLEKYAPRAIPFLLPSAYVLVSLPPFGWFHGLGLSQMFSQTTFGPIILGVALAHLLNAPRGYRLASLVLGSRWAPVFILALLGLALVDLPTDISGWPRICIHWLMVALVASCVIQERHRLRTILSLWLLRRIGIVSYGIYLYHLLVEHLVLKAAGRVGITSHVPVFTAVIIATWLAAELSYWAFESRFLALKSRLPGARAGTA